LVQILQLGGIAATNMEGQASSGASPNLVFTIDQITPVTAFIIAQTEP